MNEGIIIVIMLICLFCCSSSLLAIGFASQDVPSSTIDSSPAINSSPADGSSKWLAYFKAACKSPSDATTMTNFITGSWNTDLYQLGDYNGSNLTCPSGYVGPLAATTKHAGYDICYTNNLSGRGDLALIGFSSHINENNLNSLISPNKCNI